jgi:hypothetical protein
MIVIVDKYRYLKLYNRVVSKYYTNDIITCRGLDQALSLSYDKVVYSMYCMYIAKG